MSRNSEVIERHNLRAGIRLQVDRESKEPMNDIDQASYKPDAGAIDKGRFRFRVHLPDRSGTYCGRNARPLPRIGERQERLF
jgi:hypothetical protein